MRFSGLVARRERGLHDSRLINIGSGGYCISCDQCSIALGMRGMCSYFLLTPTTQTNYGHIWSDLLKKDFQIEEIPKSLVLQLPFHHWNRKANKQSQLTSRSNNPDGLAFHTEHRGHIIQLQVTQWGLCNDMPADSWGRGGRARVTWDKCTVV